MEWLQPLIGVVAGIIAMLPVVRKYLEKLAKIIKAVADLIASFIILESIQEQFLRQVTVVLENPEKLSDYLDSLKKLVEAKKEEFNKLEDAFKKLRKTI